MLLTRTHSLAESWSIFGVRIEVKLGVKVWYGMEILGTKEFGHSNWIVGGRYWALWAL